MTEGQTGDSREPGGTTTDSRVICETTEVQMSEYHRNGCLKALELFTN